MPRAMLPEIRPSAEVYGEARGELAGVSVAAAIGDQQAALFGQVCFEVGDAKCTYGTGSFMLLNTGPWLVQSGHGLVTTVCAQVGSEPPTYALEGSIAITGALVQWVRDKLELIGSALRSRRSPAACRTAAAVTSCRPSRASTPRAGAATRVA